MINNIQYSFPQSSRMTARMTFAVALPICFSWNRQERRY